MIDMRNFQKSIDDIRFILLNKPSLRYLGAMLYGCKIHMLENNSSNQKLYGYTCGKDIYLVNNNLNAATGELMFTILHELFHILGMHTKRKKGKINEIFQKAADHVVNEMIIELSNSNPSIRISEDIIFYKDIARKYPNSTVEFVYDLLLKESGGSIKDDEINNLNVSADNVGKNILDNMKTLTTKIDGKDVTVSYDAECLDDNMSAGALKQIHTELINNVKIFQTSSHSINSLTPNKSRSIDKSVFGRYLDSIAVTKINWTDAMKSAILYYVQGPSTRTWRRINYYMPISIRTPGKIKKGEGLGALVIGVDTSGSITSEELSLFAGCIKELSVYYSKVYLILHTVDVYSTIELESKDVFSIEESLKNIQFEGGGTSHDDVFSKIEDLNQINDISTILFLTDFVSDVDIVYHKYEFIKHHEVIWVISGWTKQLLNKVFLGNVKYKYVSIKGPASHG